jgi:amidase
LVTTWITRFDRPAAGVVRVAVKDAIDVAGAVTTAGCAAVRDRAVPAAVDAACLAGVRAAGAAIVGKTTLSELCLNTVGDNEVFGTPVNPVAPDRIPGGSSSGSAVAVASGEADVGLGTDTGGSVRIPAACCEIVGLKTTWGRVPTAGVWPLAPTLDTVGPLARDVAGVVTGMRLLTPGFRVAPDPARRIGRLRLDGVDPSVEEAVDAALAVAGIEVREIELPGWDATHDAFGTIITGELWRAHPDLLDAAGVGGHANDGLRAGRTVTDDGLAAAMSVRAAWQSSLSAVLGDVDVLALPTLAGLPPRLSERFDYSLNRLTAPISLAGVPAISLPVPGSAAGLQLVGPRRGEELLCATALAVERSLGRDDVPDVGSAPTVH